MSDHGARPVRPVILAGGSGTRLWPLSRSRRPKQLLPLLGPSSLFEQTLARLGEGFLPAIVVANEVHGEALIPLLPEGAHLILEPVKRDSAPAIALAALVVDDDELLLVCPSDHHVSDLGAFRSAVAMASDAAQHGAIVTFGIEPDHPATGYGYIAAEPGEGVRPVARFVEKPPLADAQQMVASGGHYWNAGIFLASAKTWREEIGEHAPLILAAARSALEHGRVESTIMHVDEAAFAASPARSIDYAVMEHSDRVAVLPVEMGWSDIGSWQALVEASSRDAFGNSLPDGVLALDCRNLLVRTSGPKVAAIGVDGLVIVVTEDAVLVTAPDHAQRVREAADWFEQGEGI